MNATERDPNIEASTSDSGHYCGLFGRRPNFRILLSLAHALAGVLMQYAFSIVRPLTASTRDLKVALDTMVGRTGSNAICCRAELSAFEKTRLSEFSTAFILVGLSCSQGGAMTT